MNTTQSDDSYVGPPLVGLTVDALMFVQDYAQLETERGPVNFMIWPDIIVDGRTWTTADSVYRSLLVMLVGRSFTRVRAHEMADCELGFDNGFLLRFPLAKRDSVVEGVVFNVGDNCWIW